jgi:hypothetical protein
MPQCARIAFLLFPLFVSNLPSQDLYEETAFREIELKFAQPNYWQLLLQNYASKTYIKADLVFMGKTYKNVGVRFRGNSSYKAIGTSQKKPFRISMDQYVPGQRLLGYKSIKLNNSYRDPTYTREVLSYWVYRKFMPASKANFMTLKINGQSWGVYINVQSVNKDMVAEWFRGNSGNRYKAERANNTVSRDAPALVWLGSQSLPYQSAYQLKTSQPVQPWVDLIQVCKVLNLSGNKLSTDLPKVLDLDETLRYLVGMNLLPSVDSYLGQAAHNYYLYQDPFHSRMSILPWDFNASFGGNNWLTVPQKQKLDPYYFANRTGRPLLNKVLQVPALKERYLAFYRRCLAEIYRWDVLGAKITQYQKLVEAELKKDGKKLYSMAQFKDNVTKDVLIRYSGFRFAWIPGLKPMIQTRRTFLLAHPDLKKVSPPLSLVDHKPLQPTAQENVLVRAKLKVPNPGTTCRIRFRTRGVFGFAPMFDDGKHGDAAPGDGLYAGKIPPHPWGSRVEYYIEAQSTKGPISFAPAFGSHNTQGYRVARPNGSGPIWINEFLAKNKKGIKDEKGQREDWIELYNSSPKSIDLSGFWLSDDLNTPKKWAFPQGTKIPAKGFLLVFADNDLQDGPLHSNFKLSGGGEEVALFAKDGSTLLDFFAFGAQQNDISTARLKDGGLIWVTRLETSPKTTNSVGVCGVRRFHRLDAIGHPLELTLAGSPKIGTKISLNFQGGPVSRPGILLLGAAGTHLGVLPGGNVLLVLPPFVGTLPLLYDSTGGLSVAISLPSDPALVGISAYLQAFGLPITGLSAGNALEMRFCK